MTKTNEHKIAKLLVDLYKGLEASQMTDAERNILLILNELENRHAKSGPSGWNSDEIDFFRKLIKQHEEAFVKSASANTISNESIPKPIFRPCDYGDEEQTSFWKAYIENIYKKDDTKNENKKMPNRKANYNFNKKIDIEQDYDFVMRVLNDLNEDEKFPNLNYNENSLETNLYHQFRSEIVDKSITHAKTLDNNMIFNDEDVCEIWNSRSDIHDYRIIIYLFSLQDLWLALKPSLLSNVPTYPDSKITQKLYYVRWNLWIFVIMQNFQYLFKYGFINKDDTPEIINSMQEIGTTIQSHEDLKDRPNIANAYFNYNYLLKIRTMLLEEIRFGCIKPDHYAFVKPEDLFLDENDIYTKYSCRELFKKFHSGSDKMCDMKTFNRRLKFCKEFAEKYSKLAGRNLNHSSNKVLRAVYRALYINPCEYDRMSPATMARKILEGDEKALSKHYLLGMSISRELQLEEPNGKEFEVEKMKFMKEFYVLALDIINKSLPNVSTSVNCLNKLLDGLDEKMKKFLKLFYMKIKPIMQ